MQSGQDRSHLWGWQPAFRYEHRLYGQHTLRQNRYKLHILLFVLYLERQNLRYLIQTFVLYFVWKENKCKMTRTYSRWLFRSIKRRNAVPVARWQSLQADLSTKLQPVFYRLQIPSRGTALALGLWTCPRLALTDTERVLGPRVHSRAVENWSLESGNLPDQLWRK
jgi:hypothetical protein